MLSLSLLITKGHISPGFLPNKELRQSDEVSNNSVHLCVTRPSELVVNFFKHFQAISIYISGYEQVW